jgi:hypothetical protein
MISLTIFINGKPIKTVRAINISKEAIEDKDFKGECDYCILKEGIVSKSDYYEPVKPEIKHKRSDGAIRLAIKMLEYESKRCEK